MLAGASGIMGREQNRFEEWKGKNLRLFACVRTLYYEVEEKKKKR